MGHGRTSLLGSEPGACTQEGSSADNARGQSRLLVRISRGDQNALGPFYDLTSPLVYGFALTVLGDAGQAEAAAQETYFAVWTLAPTFDPKKATPQTWLIGIATHKIGLALKRRCGHP